MLDADSVFERLLREAANLVPKMSTPKLTNALKVTSTLHQRITETVTSRLQLEKNDLQISDEQFSLESVFPQNTIKESVSLNASESSDENSPNKQGQNSYGTLTILPQMNHLGTVVSTCSGLNPTTCGGTIFVPMSTASGHSASASLIHGSPSSSCSSSVETAACQGTSATTNATTTTTGVHCSTPTMLNAGAGSVSADTGTVNGASQMSYSVPDDGTVKSTSSIMSDCNGQKANAIEYCETGSDHNGQSTADDSIEMKPEPLETRTSLSMNSLDACVGAGTLTVSTPTELASIAFTQLPPLLPFMPHSSSSGSIPTAGTVIKLGSRMSTIPTSTTVTLDAVSQSELTGCSSKSNPGNGPYRCRDCDKEFRILRYLEKHRRIHTGEKPYQCCYCGRQFNDWPNMNRHKRIHTGERPYRCSVCAKTFSQPAVYNEHVKRHTGERPYICGVCTKGFPRAARLAVHMRVHTGERPYPCTSCERRFSQPHHLAAHLRVHSGDRPYSCPKCDVSFACISNLRRHRKQVHPSSPVSVSDGTDTTMVGLDDKKPSLPRLTGSGSSEANAGSATTVNLDSASSLLTAVSSHLGGSTDAPPVALAAAMSGTLLTATGAALVPANLLPSSSSGIPGLILTSGPPGTILAAAPAHFPEHQHSQLQPTLIASWNDRQAQQSWCITNDKLEKNDDHWGCIGNKATSNADSLRQTAVTFITSTGELDRSCAGLTGATLTSAGPEGGLLVNSSSGETVYLEPLDPRMTFEPGQPFTLTTIPTSNPHGTATILGPSYAGAQLLGHCPVQLQQGSHGATHIAFTTNLPGHTPQLLAPNNTVVFSTNNTTVTTSNPGGQSTMYANQTPGGGGGTTTMIFPQLQHSGAHNTIMVTSPSRLQQQPQSVLHSTMITTQASGAPIATTTGSQQQPQLLHYHRSVSDSRSTASPGRPSSTPTQQQQQQSVTTATMLVPILTTLNASLASDSGCEAISVSSTPTQRLNSNMHPSSTTNSTASSSLGPISVTTSLTEHNL